MVAHLIDGSRTHYDVKTFEGVVTVTVPAAQRRDDVIGWIVANWVVVAGVVAAVVALGRWIMRGRCSARSHTTEQSTADSC